MLTQVTWGCEGKRAELETEKDGRKFYYAYPIKGKKKKIYCKYDSRLSLETAIMEKRTGLKRAIEIYMEEVAIPLCQESSSIIYVSRYEERPSFYRQSFSIYPCPWSGVLAMFTCITYRFRSTTLAIRCWDISPFAPKHPRFQLRSWHLKKRWTEESIKYSPAPEKGPVGSG